MAFTIRCLHSSLVRPPRKRVVPKIVVTSATIYGGSADHDHECWSRWSGDQRLREREHRLLVTRVGDDRMPGTPDRDAHPDDQPPVKGDARPDDQPPVKGGALPDDQPPYQGRRPPATGVRPGGDVAAGPYARQKRRYAPTVTPVSDSVGWKRGPSAYTALLTLGDEGFVYVNV